MKRTVDFAGYFRNLSGNPETVIASAAAWASLSRIPQPDRAEIKYSEHGGRLRLVAHLRQDQWSEFGVFGLSEPFVEQRGGDEIAAWLVRLSRGLGAALGRSYVSSTVPMLEEVKVGPDCLHWLQYFGSDIGKRWSRESLERGPFYSTTVFDDGAVAISLGETPFGNLRSIKAAAAYLHVPLRPLLGKDMQGRQIELNWP
jgi:hypothetical protein